MVAYCFGNAPPFSYRATGQRQLGRPLQPCHLRGWRGAHSSGRQLAAPVAAAGQQGNDAGEGSGSGSSSSGGGCGSSKTNSRSSSGNRSSGSSSNSAKVDSVLTDAGLDIAELQREDPAVYSLLSVPLARVLAEVQLDRLTTKARLVLHPAQLMARICFLAYDVGLTAEQIRARHRQNATSWYFDLKGAQQLLGWLRSQHVSKGQLRVASMSNTQLWATDVGAAQCSKQQVQQRLGVTDAQWVQAFNFQPTAFAARPEVLDGVIAWLEAEPLEFSTAEIRQLWQSIPELFRVPAAKLQHKLQSLLSRCPLSKQQLRSFMRGQSSLLQLDPESLLAKLDSLVAELPGLETRLDRLLVLGGTALNLEKEVLHGKISCLVEYGFSKAGLAKVILKHPMTLASSWGGKLQPKLETLEGVLGSRQAVVAAVSKAPDLLGSALDTLKGNFCVLEGLGLSGDEVQHFTARQPQLLTVRFDSADFQATLRYFESVLGKPPRQMFVQCPGYLKSGLLRIDYKVSFMERKGDTHFNTTLSWIADSDDRFWERYGYSLAEFKAWEGQWLQSERAREYGLDKPRMSGMQKAQAARQKERKSQVAARRKQRLAGFNRVDGAV